MQVNIITQAVLFFGLLLTASLWDIRTRMIPDRLCVLICASGLLTFTPDKLYGILLGLPLLIATLRKEGGIGGGDIKLTASCGSVLGLPVGCAGLIMGLTTVLIWFLCIKAIHRVNRMALPKATATPLPLAPFLTIGFSAAAIINLGGYFI